jgi:BirA family biotin operon repressor/biotin-[acetyl-CoA-carboxylase] ligase
LEETTSVLDDAFIFIGRGSLPLFGSVLAKRQTAGRGRRGSHWVSEPGHVYAALRLPLSPPFSESSASLTVAWLLAKALEEMDPGLEIKIKWPNDLIVFGGKAGGILLENRQEALVAGIGLNIGTPPAVSDRDPAAPAPSALPGHLGPPERLWQKLSKTCLRYYNDYLRRCSEDWPRAVAASAERRLFGMGRKAVVADPATTPKIDASLVEGVIIGLDPKGGLRLSTPQGPLVVWSGALRIEE